MKNKSSKSKPTHFYASISIAIVLFLLGLFFMLFVHTQDIANLLKEKVNIVVELEEGAKQEALMEKLRANEIIISETVKFIPREQGLSFMTSGGDEVYTGENPLRDLIVFNVKSTSYSDANLKKIADVLETQPGVSSVFYENMVLDQIRSNIRKVASVIFVLGIVFVFLATVIIKNTINLSMFADRAEIQTLERIGAKWGFIKMPYIKSSVLVGVRGYVIAGGMLAIMLVAVSVQFPELWRSLNMFYLLLSFILLFVVAVCIPAVVSNAAANRYLSEN